MLLLHQLIHQGGADQSVARPVQVTIDDIEEFTCFWTSLEGVQNIDELNSMAR